MNKAKADLANLSLSHKLTHKAILPSLAAISQTINSLTDGIIAYRRRHGLKPLLLDTCILTHLAADSAFASAVAKMILADKFILVFSVLNMMEIRDHRRWPEICNFIGSVPFEILATPDQLVALEVSRYPNPIQLPIKFSSIESGYSTSVLADALKVHIPGKISNFDEDYRSYRPEILKSLQDQVKNYPPGKNGKYDSGDWCIFKQGTVLQLLLQDHNWFFAREKESKGTIDVDCFKSLVAQTAVVFEEYYAQRKSGIPSDIIDFLLFPYLPYVHLAVLDKARVDAANRINKKGWLGKDFNVINLQALRQMAQEWCGKTKYDAHS